MNSLSRKLFQLNYAFLHNKYRLITALSQKQQFIHLNSENFAGHSKWANIKHIKALKDGQRAVMFTKLSRQIRLAIQEGKSTNPQVNTILRNAIDDAQRKNMPTSTIQNIIKKCDLNKEHIKKYILEIRAFKKIYMVCLLYTDNFPGLKMNIAPILKKSGAVFAEAVPLFEDKGIIEAKIDDTIKNKLKSINELEEHCTTDAIESLAEEIEVVDYENGLVNFFCNPIDLDRITGELRKRGYKIESTEHVFIPKVSVTLSDSDLKAYEIFKNKIKVVEGIEEIYDNLQNFDENQT